MTDIPAGEWTGTADLAYAFPRRVSKRKWWALPLFYIRHRWHSQIVHINGGAYTPNMKACARCGVFISTDGTQSGTIRFTPDKPGEPTA